MTPKLNRWKRFADWDERPLRLDKFAAEDPANGFSAFSSPAVVSIITAPAGAWTHQPSSVRRTDTVMTQPP